MAAEGNQRGAGDERVRPHDFVARDRKMIRLTGVTDVESFDDTTVSLKTVLGGLTIDGEGLHITSLNLQDGSVDIEGTLNGLFYASGVTGGTRGKAKKFLR